MKEFLIAASRGRDPDSPSNRSSGISTVQRLEINNKGICNTLTTVLKDNYVIEIEVENEYSRGLRITTGPDRLR